MKRPQPQPPHRRGTFHRRLQPLYTEKQKVSCSGFLPNTKPMQHHAAIPMRSATTASRNAENYAHRNNPRCKTHRRNNSRQKRPQPQPPHRRGTFHRRLQPLYVSCSGFLANSPLPFVLLVYGSHCRLENISESGHWLETEQYECQGQTVRREAGQKVSGVLMRQWRQLRQERPELFQGDEVLVWSQPSAVVDSVIYAFQQALEDKEHRQAVDLIDAFVGGWTSLPHHFPSSPLPFIITSLLHHFPSSPLPFFTTSLPHHFPSSPLPVLITSLLHHFPSSPLPFIITSLLHPPCVIASYFFVMYCYVTYHPSSRSTA